MSQMILTRHFSASFGGPAGWTAATVSDAAAPDASDGVIRSPDITVPPNSDYYISGVVNNTGTIYLITSSNGGENGTQLQLTGSASLEGAAVSSWAVRRPGTTT